MKVVATVRMVTKLTCATHKTRNVIERAFGVLKKRWRCLLRGLDLSMENATWVTVMCFMLHNVCMARQDPQPYQDEEYEHMKRWYDEHMENSGGGSSQEVVNGVHDVIVTYVNTEEQ